MLSKFNQKPKTKKNKTKQPPPPKKKKKKNWNVPYLDFININVQVRFINFIPMQFFHKSLYIP